MSSLSETGITPDAPLLLIGCGKMGGALLNGWIAGGLPAAAVAIAEPSPAPELITLAAEDGLRLASDAASLDIAPRAIIAAIKPQMMETIMPALGQRFGTAPTWLSIAAGTPISLFERIAGDGARVVRVMPNTPSAVGKGVSALFANPAATEADHAMASALLDAVGTTVWLETEAQMDVVTGVSGSGPAYVFHLIEALAKAAQAEGLAPELAMALARQTVIGAAALADAAPESAATLRENVTSPGGTTAAGLSVLMGYEGLPDLMTRTVAAAAQRSRELS